MLFEIYRELRELPPPDELRELPPLLRELLPLL